jgi:hypothetical protein
LREDKLRPVVPRSRRVLAETVGNDMIGRDHHDSLIIFRIETPNSAAVGPAIERWARHELDTDTARRTIKAR